MLSLPQGFSVYVFQAGVKPGSNRLDVGVLYSEVPASYAGVFTSNRVFAAPVRLCRERLGHKIQVVTVNSGNANACTGEEGYLAALNIARAGETYFGGVEGAGLSLSTGVIGVQLPWQKIVAVMEPSDKKAGTAEDFSRAIMTTDAFPKALCKELMLDGKKVTLSGFAKGAGMISPNMATMLSFIATDADIEPKLLQKVLGEVVGDTFNSITVDGDMSTNDSVILLANGKSGVSIKKGDFLAVFKQALFEVMEHLAKEVVRDGEGATKLIEISVEGAKDDKEARQVGMAVANSLLVKTAFFGNDPNWGRILAAAGYSGAEISEEQTQLYFFDTCLFHGSPQDFDRKALVEKLKNAKEVPVRIQLNRGKVKKRFFTSDLGHEYVRINAEYTT